MKHQYNHIQRRSGAHTSVVTPLSQYRGASTAVVPRHTKGSAPVGYNTHFRGSKSSPPKKRQPKTPVKVQASVGKSTTSLTRKLAALIEQGILVHSLLPNDSNSNFERYEWYGDAVLYEAVTGILNKSRSFMSVYMLTTIRQRCICNDNLAGCFDSLGLHTLLSFSQQPQAYKSKADVVESIIGELADHREHSPSIESILHDLISYVHYVGEKHHFSHNDSNPGVPSAEVNISPARSALVKTSDARMNRDQPQQPKSNPSPVQQTSRSARTRNEKKKTKVEPKTTGSSGLQHGAVRLLQRTTDLLPTKTEKIDKANRPAVNTTTTHNKPEPLSSPLSPKQEAIARVYGIQNSTTLLTPSDLLNANASNLISTMGSRNIVSWNMK